MTFSDAKDQIAKRIGYDSMDEMFKLLGGNTLREAKHSQFFHVINEAAELYAEEKAREQMIKLLDWYDKLTPSQKVSVWSKNGEYKGLFNMDSEQLVDQFLRPEFKP